MDNYHRAYLYIACDCCLCPNYLGHPYGKQNAGLFVIGNFCADFRNGILFFVWNKLPKTEDLQQEIRD